MNIRDRIKTIRAGIKFANKRGFQSIADLDRLLDEQFLGAQTNSGVGVSAQSAMNYSAWFNGCQQISQTVASLPLIVYKRRGTTKKHYTTYPLYKLFRKKVNIRMSAFTWKECTQYHLLSWGNSYSYIERDAGFRPIGLWLFNPDGMKKIYVMSDGSLQYEFMDNKGNTKIYSQDEILHIPGFGFDGIRGYSVLTLAREAIGLGLAQEEFSARFFGHGTNIGGFLEHPGTLSQKAKPNLIKSFNDAASGLANVHKTILLEEGMKFNRTVMPLKDAQFLEGRTFSVQEMARWLNMPPHKLKDLSKATYSNIEQEQSTYYQDTIRPWLERQESCMDAQLLPENDFDSYVEYDINAILRADVKTRYETYDIARRNGVINADEWRDAENMNPIGEDHGKIYLIPVNMMDASKLGEMPEKPMEDPAKKDGKEDINNENDEEDGNNEDIDKKNNNE